MSLYYFNHRESLDLDFFTQDFNKMRIDEIIGLISNKLKKQTDLIAQELRKDRIKILVYSVNIDKKQALKVDFIQDYLDCLKPLRTVNGIKVLSLEDIYMRKIYAMTGTYQAEDETGRIIFRGGRQEAKDFYDLYCLSHIFKPLSDFSFRYGNQLMREAIIRWFRTYNRMDMKTGLLELQLKKNINYTEIERHFKQEVNSILEKEVEFI